MTGTGHDAGVADRLYAAHVAFELRQWRGKTRRRRLRQEVDALWDWAQTTPVDAVLDADQARQIVRRLLLDGDLPDSLGTLLGYLAASLVEMDINRRTRVRDVVDQALFDDGVGLFVALEDLRKRLIEQALDSPVYAAIATDVLYQGIKDYIFSDHGALGNIPGVGSLLRGSASAVNRRVPGLEAQVEKRVRAYIEANIGKTLARSQALLRESLDADRIRAIADEVWAAARDMNLSMADVLTNDDIDTLAAFGLRAWRDLRPTEYAAELLAAGVDAFYARYGSRSLAELLGDVGVDRALLLQEVEALAEPVIDALLETGWLQAAIERRLAPFYRSKAFVDALEND